MVASTPTGSQTPSTTASFATQWLGPAVHPGREPTQDVFVRSLLVCLAAPVGLVLVPQPHPVLP
jgi:hypothetical protein